MILITAKHAHCQQQQEQSSMTSLSQYPAEETLTRDVVVHRVTRVSLMITTLFVYLHEVRPRARDMALLVPMTLATSCRDVSLGMAAKGAERDMENSESHLPGGTQPTFLVAARDKYAQINPETGVPEGFVHSVMDLVNSTTANATLMTPTCRMFSKMPKTCNLKSRPLLVSDMDGLKGAIDDKCAEVGIERGIQHDENSPIGALQLFVELLFMLQRLFDNVGTMQETYNILAESNPEATSRFKATETCRQLNLQLAECGDDEEDAVERCYWLAVSLLLQELCPVFLSPVSAAHKTMSAIISNSTLRTRYGSGDFPFLYIKGDDNPPSRAYNVSVAKPKVLCQTTTVFGPVDDSAKSLGSSIRFLYQKALEAANNVDSTDGQFEETHR